MKTLKRIALVSLLFLLPACGQQVVEFALPGTTDARTIDAGIADSRNSDAGSPDAGKPDMLNTDVANPDAGNTDVGNIDGANPDARTADGANIDGANIDGANPDTRATDAGSPDVGKIDGASSDARAPDAGNTDVGNRDAANTDARNPDVGNIDAANPDAANSDTGTTDGGSSEGGNTDTPSACVQAPVALGAAGNFVVLAGSTVTNAGQTSVTGDLGVSPGTAVTGFPPGTIVGAQHAGDPTAAQGVADLTTAYNDAAGRTLCAVTVAGNIGGQTLSPGLYKSTSSLEISSGDLTLDAQGDANAVFIFQIASTLTTTSGRQVILSGGAKSSNVFWQVGTSATLGTTSAFQGTIMADQAITLNTSATLNGRALARIAAVTLDSNTIAKPAP
jgi:hypothetical protein